MRGRGTRARSCPAPRSAGQDWARVPRRRTGELRLRRAGRPKGPFALLRQRGRHLVVLGAARRERRRGARGRARGRVARGRQPGWRARSSAAAASSASPPAPGRAQPAGLARRDRPVTAEDNGAASCARTGPRRPHRSRTSTPRRRRTRPCARWRGCRRGALGAARGRSCRERLGALGPEAMAVEPDGTIVAGRRLPARLAAVGGRARRLHRLARRPPPGWCDPDVLTGSGLRTLSSDSPVFGVGRLSPRLGLALRLVGSAGPACAPRVARSEAERGAGRGAQGRSSSLGRAPEPHAVLA